MGTSLFHSRLINEPRIICSSKTMGIPLQWWSWSRSLGRRSHAVLCNISGHINEIASLTSDFWCIVLRWRRDIERAGTTTSRRNGECHRLLAHCSPSRVSTDVQSRLGIIWSLGGNGIPSTFWMNSHELIALGLCTLVLGVGVLRSDWKGLVEKALKRNEVVWDLNYISRQWTIGDLFEISMT